MARVTRSIHFYQIVDKFTGTPLTQADVLGLWSQFRNACRNATSSYVDVGNDEVCRPWVDEHQSIPFKLRFGKTRKSGLPQIEGQGAFRPIAINPALGEGINDLSHVVAFRDGVVGHEFNWYAPRLGTLAFYAQEKTSHSVKFVPLLNRSAADRLDQLGELYSFNLKVRSEYLEELRTASRPLREAIERLNEFGGNHDLEINIKADRRTDRTLATRVVDTVKGILRRSNRDGLKKLTVSGLNEETGKIDEIDLLREFLVARKEVVTADQRLRTVDTDSAYRAIESAYRELRDEIVAATGAISD